MSETKIPEPYYRWEGFEAFHNPDGTFHMLVVSGDGGYIFCDRFNSEEDADWAAAVFNAALQSRR